MPALTADQFIHESTEDVTTAWISEAGQLSQFGAFIEVLQPGAQSSIKHWHSAEDEMVYVLDGEVTLVEGETETVLRPGDAATFRSGVAVGHTLHNRSALPTRCLVVGTRAALYRITYPDHDRVCIRDRSLPDDVWTTLDGAPAASPY
ncbi:cupin domain-containing protein [Massilia sp. TN1-12]|uniref:cupin domain-containing protein n=1 Tax=Massilia paldalensis TaxID=3377675 RepID=UPI00384EB97A